MPRGGRGSGRGVRGSAAAIALTAGGGLLTASLFLPWSHQLSPAYAGTFSGTGALLGVGQDLTAWQVYSAADVLLVLLGAGFCVLGVKGRRTAPLVAVGLWAVALAFVIHALVAPPTNGVIPATVPGAATPGAGLPVNQPNAGVGETVALVALGLAGAGLALSLSGRRPRARGAARAGAAPITAPSQIRPPVP